MVDVTLTASSSILISEVEDDGQLEVTAVHRGLEDVIEKPGGFLRDLRVPRTL
jgi:hypothetical protein